MIKLVYASDISHKKVISTFVPITLGEKDADVDLIEYSDDNSESLAIAETKFRNLIDQGYDFIIVDPVIIQIISKELLPHLLSVNQYLADYEKSKSDKVYFNAYISYDGNKDEYKLIDCQSMHDLYPNTFEIPSKEDIQNLSTESIVKLVFDNMESGHLPERMWALIEIIDNGKFVGRLVNYPSDIMSLNYWSKIEFEAKHIASIYIRNEDEDEEEI